MTNHQKCELTTAANSRFAKAGISCFNESEVLNSSLVHLMKFSAKNPRLRKAAKRCGLCSKKVLRKIEIFEEINLVMSIK